jgi:hypothetical protein
MSAHLSKVNTWEPKVGGKEISLRASSKKMVYHPQNSIFGAQRTFIGSKGGTG